MQGFTLRPGETLPVYWIPSDPYDVNTYYPQSIFINALNGSAIATLNLDKQANGSYTNSLLVPNDPSNLGMYIVETLNVYTDASHTTLTGIYTQEQRTHKIKNETQNYGGASVDGTDYKYIENLVKKIVYDAIATIKFEQKEVNFEPLMTKVDNIIKTHKKFTDGLNSRLEKIENKEIDFPKGEYEGHFNSVSELISIINSGIAEFRGELSPTIKKHLDEKHLEDHEAFIKSHSELSEKIPSFLQEIKSELESRFDGVDHIVYDRDKKPERKESEEDKTKELLKGLIL